MTRPPPRPPEGGTPPAGPGLARSMRLADGITAVSGSPAYGTAPNPASRRERSTGHRWRCVAVCLDGLVIPSHVPGRAHRLTRAP
jgi:hypothetical protein